MATLLLQAAGATIGSFFGPVGSAIGSAIGSAAGYYLDQSLINSTRHIEGARLTGAQPMTADEGAAVARVYGYARISTTVIWGTEFEEQKTTKRQGAKGGPKVTSYSYFGNVALGLCEGKIGGIKRIWADGKEIDLRDLEYRVYLGDENQNPDPLIEAKQGEGNTPAYRGLAYIVFERLPLERFGNRIPQIQVEVIRPVGKLEQDVRAITLIPGATEHGLSPSSVTIKTANNETQEVNRHINFADNDWQASIDELQAICPNLEHVSLVVTWYCDDLRAGHASVKPGIIDTNGQSESQIWRVNGMSRNSNGVHLISKVDERAVYGGTPSDASVIAAIQDLKNRELKVTINPFILMDIPANNTLPDPYSDGIQSAFPWRGRMSCYPAISRPNSVDKSPIARTQIDTFLNAADGYKNMFIHYAQLVEQAGGVDTFLIGSEMRGLTRIRDENNAFPFVDGLVSLTSDVRTILNAHTAVTYGADWSEYFGYHPQDGSGDIFYNLDPLWSDPNISAIGIDNYMPLSDWRQNDADTGRSNPDGMKFQSDKEAMQTAIVSGEGFDWYYASESDRFERLRTPIEDGAYNKPWVFRYKDLQSWWQNTHYNRIGGVEENIATDWVPQSKQFWMMEVGCPAVQAGATQPNVFIDEKSSESALPHFSNGSRDDSEQRAFLEAHHTYWKQNSAGNPISTIDQKPMVDPDRLYIWAWDARPFPAFPLNLDYWGDGENWMRGHWVNGRLGTAPAADLIETIFLDHGFSGIKTQFVTGAIGGMVVGQPVSLRGTLEPLLQVISATVHDVGFNIGEQNLVRSLDSYEPIIVAENHRIDNPTVPIYSESTSQISEWPRQVTINYRDPMNDYQSATHYSRRLENGSLGQFLIDVPCILETNQAAMFVEKMLGYQWAGRKKVSFALPIEYSNLAPGDVIAFDDIQTQHWLIERITLTDVVTIEARSISKPHPLAQLPQLSQVSPSDAYNGLFGGPPTAITLDLPMADGSTALNQFRIAVSSKPKRTQAVYISPSDQGFELRQTIEDNAEIGTLTRGLEASFSGRIDRQTIIEVALADGEFESKENLLIYSGQNAIAVQSISGAWEIIQFAKASEVAPGLWQLSELLRGQLGSEDAMIAGAIIGAKVVVLDEAILPIGITDSEVGLTLNLRIGATGKEFSDRYFETQSVAGGLRALTPLSPVHLSAITTDAGDVKISWIRRSRINADSWLGSGIPLGEDVEEYVVELLDDQKQLLLRRTVSEPFLQLNTVEMSAISTLPTGHINVCIRQISQRVGEGIAAEKKVLIS